MKGWVMDINTLVYAFFIWLVVYKPSLKLKKTNKRKEIRGMMPLFTDRSDPSKTITVNKTAPPHQRTKFLTSQRQKKSVSSAELYVDHVDDVNCRRKSSVIYENDWCSSFNKKKNRNKLITFMMIKIKLKLYYFNVGGGCAVLIPLGQR